jgi:hypothetical protein
MFEDRTTQQLRDELTAYNRAEQAKAEEVIPLPAGTPRATMSLDAQEQAFANWQEFILAKNSRTWDEAERNAIRVASTRVLRTL